MKEKNWRKDFILVTLGVVIFWTLIFLTWITLVQSVFGSSVRPEKANLFGFKIYHSKKLGVRFEYPEILKVREQEGIITLEHSIKFQHPNPCDKSGLPPYQNSKAIYDFYAKMAILNKTPTEIFREEVMEINHRGLVVGVKNSVRVTYGELDGFRIYNGNHGCGPYSYFFQMADEKVLRVDRWPAPEFREVPEEERQMHSRLRMIILPEQEEPIFRSILSSLKWGDGR